MKRPNILVVMTDHQRGDTVLPEHPSLTPNIRRLADEGVMFSEAYCPTPHCCPSRATFFTGLYPTSHGVWNNICNDQALSRGLKPGVKVFSEDLAAAGYTMHYAGKWHVSVETSPKDHGFTEHYVSGVKGESHGQRWDQFKNALPSDAKKTAVDGTIKRPGYNDYTLYGTREKQGHDEQTHTAAVKALRELKNERDPWMLYVSYIAPHDPYMVPKKYLDMYKLDDIPLPANYHDTMRDKPRVYQRMRDQVFGQLSETEVREGIRHFWAYCTYLDDLFGELMRELDATGQADDTLVIYTSDHGDYCGEHGLFAKGIPNFKGAYHVPAVMRWPNGIKNPRRRIDEFVSLADFAPTFLELAGVKTDRYFSGSSFAPLLQDNTPADWHDEMHFQCNGVELYYTQRAVKTKAYKYTFNGFDFDELYDLEKDPHEMVNVSDKPEYEAVKREMCRRMWRFSRKENDGATNPYITVGLAPYGPGIAFE
ncbi:MAG: sulfatase-like hydrolase/transferase [Spirochaetes bacterium]|nr:sulfatase-like hydrolase/transferase [Spirochaetota bacterium]